jgi:hypothetical protein
MIFKMQKNNFIYKISQNAVNMRRKKLDKTWKNSSKSFFKC